MGKLREIALFYADRTTTLKARKARVERFMSRAIWSSQGLRRGEARQSTRVMLTLNSLITICEGSAAYYSELADELAACGEE